MFASLEMIKLWTFEK